jgi:hypothetical protein
MPLPREGSHGLERFHRRGTGSLLVVPQFLTANRIHFAENRSRAVSTDVESALSFLVPQFFDGEPDPLRRKLL